MALFLKYKYESDKKKFENNQPIKILKYLLKNRDASLQKYLQRMGVKFLKSDVKCEGSM